VPENGTIRRGPNIGEELVGVLTRFGVALRDEGLAIARIGSMLSVTILPPAISNPTGVFIQALVITTNTPDAAPLAATITPDSQWASAGMRSQP